MRCKPGEANKIGQMTGAKILISGSVIQIDKKIYLVAKIVGTETSRVLAAAVDGKSSDELKRRWSAKTAEANRRGHLPRRGDQLVARRVARKATALPPSR